MPLLKDLNPNLEVDYTDGLDLDGVYISGRVLKIICARIPPEEFTHKRVLNDCLEFGVGYRDEKKFIDDIAKEEQRKVRQEHGRRGGERTAYRIEDMHDEWQLMADNLFINNPRMSKREAAKNIARYSNQDWGRPYSPDHIRKYIQKR